MGGVIIESSAGFTHTEQSFVENCVKDKKKKRRSRKFKQNYSLSASSSLSEMCMDESSLSGVSNACHQQEREFTASYSSMPTVSILEQCTSSNLQIQHVTEETVFFNSSPEPSAGQEPVGPVLIARPVGSQTRRTYFPPYWSAETVDKALKDGHIFKALFRVNAHNRLEAYCKIDGVQTDVLISGAVAQNRAMEGDTVVLVIDPPSLWPRMKGSGDTSSHNICVGEHEPSVNIHGSSKGKSKLNMEMENMSSNYLVSPENGMHCEDGFPSETSSGGNYAVPVNGCINAPLQSASYLAKDCQSDDAYETVNSVEKLCALVNSLPSKRPTGRVVAVIERSLRRDNIVGFLSVKQWICSREYRKDSRKNNHQPDTNSGYVLLMPTDPKFTKMIVPVRNLPESMKKRLEAGDLTVDNDLVGATVVDWAEESYIPEAWVVQIFGRGSDVEAQIAAILFENAVDASEFSSEALSCLPPVPWEVPKEELLRRRDLRNLCIFTIDPATATDLDDALSVERLSNDVYRVGVHIADVSYFVQPDTTLAFEAQIRSTSVYLLLRKLPMLPPMLSDNVASLNPGVDRLAFSIFWDIKSTGEVLDRWIGRTVIRSCIKLSYEHAQQIIDGGFEVQDSNSMGNDWPQLYGQFKWADVIKSINTLHEISKVLKESRFKTGALCLESQKVAFLFDDEGTPYDSVLSGPRESNFLVEEFMLLANRTAAEVITRAYPSCALLRRHPEPNSRKLREFGAFCEKHGLKLDTSSSVQLHDSLERIKGELKNDSVLFDILMSYAARPMQLASYFCSGDAKETNNDSYHYALAVPLYTHFTSPLRRYPDIVVHRTLAAALEAEDIYVKGKTMLLQNAIEEGMSGKCFTGILFDKDEVESVEVQEALSIAASKHKVPCSDTLADVAAHCNVKKLASRHVKDATEKLYMWLLLKKKEVLYTEARVLGLGPRFMSVYVPKLAIERRIYYDEVEGLTADWLDATSTLVLNQTAYKQRLNRKSSPGKYKRLDEVALIVNPADLEPETDSSSEPSADVSGMCSHEPAFFPLTIHLLSTIPVALHAIGGDDGPLDIVARLHISSYF